MSWPDTTTTEIDRETIDALAQGRVPEEFCAWAALEKAKMNRAEQGGCDNQFCWWGSIPHSHAERTSARRTGW